MVLICCIFARWDDNRLRSFLEKKGIIKTKQQVTRDQLLAKMRESYTSATDPVWHAWSDSYIASDLCLSQKLKVHYYHSGAGWSLMGR